MMTIRRRHILVTVVVLVALPGCLSTSSSGDQIPVSETDTGPAPSDSWDNTSTTAVFIHDGEAVANLSLEVAETPEEKRRGLMNRETLEEGRGMVFVYDDEERRSFWMKNTYIPLDIIFVGEDGRVNAVRHASPQPNASDSDLRTYTGDAKYVIEANRGFANRTGIRDGSRVEIEFTPEDA